MQGEKWIYTCTYTHTLSLSLSNTLTLSLSHTHAGIGGNEAPKDIAHQLLASSSAAAKKLEDERNMEMLVRNIYKFCIHYDHNDGVSGPSTTTFLKSKNFGENKASSKATRLFLLKL